MNMATVTTHVPATSAAAGCKPRLGPHEDLSRLCNIVVEERDNQDKKLNCDALYPLMATVKRMLNASTQSERVAAAQEVLAQRPDCGLAYAVLAREGAQNGEEIERYYKLAVRIIGQECERHADLLDANQEADPQVESYLLDLEAFPLIAGEWARLIWERGNREQALQVILPIIDVDYYRCLSSDLMYLASGWLIQVGQDDNALALLQSEPEDLAEWYYLYALLTFRKLGDHPVSRAALRRALLESPAIGPILCSPPSAEQCAGNGQDADGEEEEEEERRYVADTQWAWLSSPGSLQWLEAAQETAVAGFSKRFNHQRSLQADFESVRAARLKRWQDHFEAAQAFIKRDNFREAKRSLRAALKEAERLDDLSWTFLLTVEALANLLGAAGAPTEEIVAVLDRRANHLRTIYESDPATLAFCYWSISARFLLVSRLDLSEQLLAEALRLFEQSYNSGDPAVTMCELMRTLSDLGYLLGEQRRYSEAASLYRRSISLQEQFLGPNHPDLAEGLDYLSRCLHRLGEHAEEAAIRERLQSELYYDVDPDCDPHKDHGSNCPWRLLACQQLSSINN